MLLKMKQCCRRMMLTSWSDLSIKGNTNKQRSNEIDSILSNLSLAPQGRGSLLGQFLPTVPRLIRLIPCHLDFRAESWYWFFPDQSLSLWWSRHWLTSKWSTLTLPSCWKTCSLWQRGRLKECDSRDSLSQTTRWRVEWKMLNNKITLITTAYNSSQ